MEDTLRSMDAGVDMCSNEIFLHVYDIYMCTYIYVYSYAYVCMCIYVCGCICVNIYIHVYICTCMEDMLRGMDAGVDMCSDEMFLHVHDILYIYIYIYSYAYV